MFTFALIMTGQEQILFYQKLGLQIREYREKAKLKQGEFAIRLNLSRASIVNIEKGRQHPPLHLLFMISQILNIELHELFGIFNKKKESSEKISVEWKATIERSVKKSSPSKKKLTQFLTEIALNPKKDVE